MGELLQEKWEEAKREWDDLGRYRRIEAVWRISNTVGAIILPILLFSTFVLSSGLPSTSTLLILIAIGIVWGGSVIFKNPVMNYVVPNEG
jgi:hypothetical protein